MINLCLGSSSSGVEMIMCCLCSLTVNVLLYKTMPLELFYICILLRCVVIGQHKEMLKCEKERKQHIEQIHSALIPLNKVI